MFREGSVRIQIQPEAGHLAPALLLRSRDRLGSSAFSASLRDSSSRSFAAFSASSSSSSLSIFSSFSDTFTRSFFRGFVRFTGRFPPCAADTGRSREALPDGQTAHAADGGGHIRCSRGRSYGRRSRRGTDRNTPCRIPNGIHANHSTKPVSGTTRRKNLLPFFPDQDAVPALQRFPAPARQGRR